MTTDRPDQPDHHEGPEDLAPDEQAVEQGAADDGTQTATGAPFGAADTAPIPDVSTTTGYALPPYPSSTVAPEAAAPSGTSNRTLWIGLGIGGAVLAALVLVGGVAFGVVLRHGDRDADRHAVMMSGGQRPDGDNGFGSPPGSNGFGYGDRGGEGSDGSGSNMGPGMPGGMLGGLGQLGGALHGQLVVPDGSGYATVAMQRGTVTAATSTSLTVRSSDGYTATYRISPATQVVTGGLAGFGGGGSDNSTATLSKGAEVSVVAKGQGQPLTAQVVALG